MIPCLEPLLTCLRVIKIVMVGAILIGLIMLMHSDYWMGKIYRNF